MGIYTGIGTGVALVLMAMAFHEAENRGRVIILSLAVLTFLLPALFPSSAIWLIFFIARILIGLGCYLYLRYQQNLP